MAAYGKQLTKDVAQLGIGKRPLDCWAAIGDALGLPATAQELFDQSEPELLARCVAERVLHQARSLQSAPHSF